MPTPSQIMAPWLTHWPMVGTSWCNMIQFNHSLATPTTQISPHCGTQPSIGQDVANPTPQCIIDGCCHDDNPASALPITSFSSIQTTLTKFYIPAYGIKCANDLAAIEQRILCSLWEDFCHLPEMSSKPSLWLMLNLQTALQTSHVNLVALE